MPPSDQPDDHHRAIEALQDRVASLNEQVEAEKRRSESKHGRHLQAVTIISVFAALVSIGSTGFTLYREHEQEKHRLRGELTSMLQRLTILKVKEKIIMKNILSRLAYNTADQIEAQVSSPEHAIVAGALLAAGDFQKSLEFGKVAVKSASNLYDKTWALRQLAWIEFQINGAAKGGDIYNTALEAYKTYGYDENSIGVKTDWAFTYVDWAKALAVQAKCQEAQAKQAEFKRWASAVVFTNDRERLQDEEKELSRYLDNCQEGQLQPQSVAAPQR
jgi:hypothetical protein